jgi:GWxTD domain-containing protein
VKHVLRLISVFVCCVLCYGCSFHPERRQTVQEGDFVEKPSSEEVRDVWLKIADKKEEVERDFQDAERHRELAVLYRMAGTPRSRLLSSEEIDKAIALDPGNPLYYVERGLTFLARRFVGEAQESFKHATELDESCFDAWFQLGRLEQYEYFKTMCFAEHCEKSIDYFAKAQRINKKNEDALVNLGFLYSCRHMYQTGLKYATRATMYHPESARAHLLCGMLYTRRNEFEKAEKEFSTAFLLMSDEEKKPYESIAPLLSSDERDLYLSSSPDKRKDWNRRFWIENDPTPSTETNERRLEHFSRVLIADWAVSDERLRTRGSETDRGAALIRFGLPDKKLYDLGSGMSGGWIVWQYDLPKGSFRLYYCDEFLNGDYHFPISDYYGEVSMRTLAAVPERYEFPIKYVSFPIGVETAELRGAEDRTKLEFSIAIPDSLRRDKNASWNLFLTFLDSQWNRFSRDRISFKPDSLSTLDKPNGRFRVLDFGIELLPRELTCTCIVEVIDEKTKSKGTRKYPLVIRDMFGRSLKLSSVMFTVPTADGACSHLLDPIPAYRARSSLCLTYEIYNLKLSESGESRYRLTYAIRNPERSDEQSGAGLQKTLSYMWSSIKGRKSDERPYVESSIEQTARAGTVSDNLQIDLAALEKGAYVLTLRVTDLTTQMTVEESRLFTIIEQIE